MAELVIERLTSAHDRKSFDCGNGEMNDFLKTKARKHGEQNFSVTWVAVEVGSPRILGYITLSMGNVGFEEADSEVYRRLPKYPIPVLHVGRLATDLAVQGKGVGALLLNFAARKAIEASEAVGCFALELIAIDANAFAYYERRGFLPLKRDTMRLYAPVETLKMASP